MPPPFDEAIFVRQTPPSGNSGATLTLDAVIWIARQFSTPGWRIEARAMELGVTPTRYLRNMNDISTADQITLLKSSIALVGLGGLGGTLFDLFLRTGIGRIRAADGDRFEESNLNRQALSEPSNLGSAKAEAATRRASRINPSIEADCRTEFLAHDTMPGFLTECDLVIDALGGLADRLPLQEAASDAKIPMITGALAGWTGYVATVYPGTPGPASFMGLDNAAEEKLGCPAPAVSLVASIMAAQAVTALTKKEKTDNAFLIIDLKSLTFEKVSL